MGGGGGGGRGGQCGRIEDLVALVGWAELEFGVWSLDFWVEEVRRKKIGARARVSVDDLCRLMCWNAGKLLCFECEMFLFFFGVCVLTRFRGMFGDREMIVQFG